jgi:hypothetical protein
MILRLTGTRELRNRVVIPSEARNLALLVAFHVPEPEQDSSLRSE